MTTGQKKPIRFFCSYAHEDRKLHEELLLHLGFLRRKYEVTIWSDTDIPGGKAWEEEIQNNLDAADIILLLISPHFINSDYCYNIEMAQALARHNKNEARTIPILLKNVVWKESPFKHLQILPAANRPIMNSNGAKRGDLFSEVAANIGKVVEELVKEQWLEEGQSLRSAGQYEQALAALAQANQLVPRTYYERGLTFLQRSSNAEDLKNALSSFNQAIQMTSTNPQYHYQRGLTLEKMGDIEEAQHAFHKTIQLDPANSMAYYQQGLVLYKMRRYKEAINDFTTVIEREPENSQAFYQRALSHRAQASSHHDLEHYLANSAGSIQPLSEKNRIYHTRRFQGLKFQEALADFAKSIQLDSENVLAYYEQGITFRDSPDQHNREHDDLDDPLHNLNRAIVSFGLALQLAPDHVLTHYDLGIALRLAERYNEALEVFAKAISLDPADARTHYERGLTFWERHASSDDLTYAIAAFSRAIQLDSEHVLAHYELGLIFRERATSRDEIDKAIAFLTTATHLAPDNAHFHYELGRTTLTSGRPQEALASFEKSIHLDSNYPPAHYEKGRALYRSKRFDEALEAFDRAIQLKPLSSNFYYEKGKTLFELKKYNRAKEAYELAIRHDPRNKDAYIGKGDALDHLERSLSNLNQALEAYEQAIQLDPHNENALMGKGNILFALKRFEEALPAYQQVLQHNPNAGFAHLKLSYIYEELARQAREKAIQLGALPRRK